VQTTSGSGIRCPLPDNPILAIKYGCSPLSYQATCFLHEGSHRFYWRRGLFFEAVCGRQQADHLGKILNMGVPAQEQCIRAGLVKSPEPHIVSVNRREQANEKEDDRDATKSNETGSNKFDRIKACHFCLQLRCRRRTRCTLLEQFPLKCGLTQHSLDLQHIRFYLSR
jgi:hypothetical protein